MIAWLSIFAIWLTAFSICYTFLPMLQVLSWRKRGTAEGFSSVNLVLPVLVMGCWLRHGYMTNDHTNMFINAVNVVIFTGYILAFAFYQPCKRYLYGQLLVLFFTLYCIYSYVSWQPEESAADVMGSIAAGMQIISLGGQIYEIKRAISFGHTEYIPAELQFGIFFLVTQWTLFGILIGNYYIAVANFAALMVNIVTISLYFIYPPLTWRVPIIGTGPQQKKVD